MPFPLPGPPGRWKLEGKCGTAELKLRGTGLLPPGCPGQVEPPAGHPGWGQTPPKLLDWPQENSRTSREIFTPLAVLGIHFIVFFFYKR